ncbi:hypothetical protein DOY81_010245 [Sarcophaga bullata]|nr:hypothetical protein DOY81_010245 [Sarcophaga bullata]
MESTSLEYEVERNCNLVPNRWLAGLQTYGIAMPFKNGGRKCMVAANCESSDAASSDTPELDLESVGGVFLVLGLGFVMCIIIGLVECLWNVKTVAVDEKEALKVETLFALKFWITHKPVHASSENSSSSSSSSSTSSHVEIFKIGWLIFVA